MYIYAFPLGETTLICIKRAADGESLQIIMSEGNLSITAQQEGKKNFINTNGRQIQAIPGSSVSIFNVTSDKDTMTLRVNEGIIDDGETAEISGEDRIAFDTSIDGKTTGFWYMVSSKQR
jgi:hypothetical protein